jgi:hypothetical protein
MYTHMYSVMMKWLKLEASMHAVGRNVLQIHWTPLSQLHAENFFHGPDVSSRKSLRLLANIDFHVVYILMLITDEFPFR